MAGRISFAVLVAALLGVLLVPDVGAARAPADARVSAGSPSTPYARSMQNEPAVAIDPMHPNIVAAGGNDLIDEAPCVTVYCAFFSPSVGISGVYFSLDGARTWTQPTYTGWSARTGTGQRGPIGTLPWYYETGANLVTDGDPAVAFGPVPSESGKFSWANGSRLYYATLADQGCVKTEHDQIVKGCFFTMVSRTDDAVTAAGGGAAGKAAWSRPVVVSADRGNTVFNDKEAVWADNTSSSPYFGNAYLCWTVFKQDNSQNDFGSAAVVLSRSTDGGTTWSTPRQLSSADNSAPPGRDAKGRQGCTVRTDSRGNVYAFWLGAIQGQAGELLARSADGGVSFEKAHSVALVTAASGDQEGIFDGVAGIGEFPVPSVDIANGAPTGADAPDEIVVTWEDGRNGRNHEEALVTTSSDRGETWSVPRNAGEGADRPYQPAVAISPNGKQAYVTYDAFLDPFRSDTTSSRRVQGVVRRAAVGPNGVLGPWTTVHRAPVGDVRGIPFRYNERWGDYNYAAATNDFGVAVWNDVRNAQDCPAVDQYRAALLVRAPDDPFPPPPAAGTDCPSGFGNSDIYGIRIDAK